MIKRRVWVLGVVVGLVLVVAGLTTRKLGNDAYEKYVARGGSKGFWSWLVRDKCNLAVPWIQAETEEPSVLAKKAADRKTELDNEVTRLEKLAKAKAAEIAATKKRHQQEAKNRKKAEKIAETKRVAARRAEDAKRRGFGPIKTGGKSSYVAGNGKTPYRVTGIKGINFGSTDNAPAIGVRPTMWVSYDKDGNMVFRDLHWREGKKLTNPIYGFNYAELAHSIDTEQLSSVAFKKNFPMTEEGLKQAVEFYNSMSQEASSDLGFKIKNVDKLANDKTAAICEFRNTDSATTIHGVLYASSEKSVTVALGVTDTAYSKTTKAQSNAAYASGYANEVDARIIPVGTADYTARKQIVNDLVDITFQEPIGGGRK